MELKIRTVKISDYMDISRIRKMPGVRENILATYNELPEKMRSKIENKMKNLDLLKKEYKNIQLLRIMFILMN